MGLPRHRPGRRGARLTEPPPCRAPRRAAPWGVPAAIGLGWMIWPAVPDTFKRRLMGEKVEASE